MDAIPKNDKDPQEFKIKKLIIPVTLAGYGVWGLENPIR